MPISLFDVIKEHAPARPPEERYREQTQLLGLSIDYSCELCERIVCLTWHIVDWEQFKRTHVSNFRVAAVWPFQSHSAETSAIHVSGDMKTAKALLPITPDIAQQLYDCDLSDAIEICFIP